MAIDWESWIYKPGGAPVPLDFSTKESNQAADLALAYIKLNGTSSPVNFTQYNSYYSNLKVVFHDTLLNNYDKVNTAILKKIDADLNCTSEADPEVRQRWYSNGLGLHYEPVYDPAHTWICSMGRVKYLSPIY